VAINHVVAALYPTRVPTYIVAWMRLTDFVVWVEDHVVDL